MMASLCSVLLRWTQWSIGLAVGRLVRGEMARRVEHWLWEGIHLPRGLLLRRLLAVR